MLLPKVWAAFVLLETAHAAVEFPSGETLEPITDLSSLGALANQLQDPKNTGSQVYDSQGFEETRLSLNFFVEDFKSPTSRYFRAHPAFMQCLQKTYNVLRRDDDTLEIAEGYRTATDSPSDVYLQSGAAAVIILGDDATTTIQELAAIVIEICVPIFQEVQGDIGLVLHGDKLLVQLQGADETGPHFRAESGAAMDTATFETWAWGQIDETYEPISIPECPADAETLASGETYPAGVSAPEDAVGVIDYPVTRDKVEDFKRLVQYPANNIVFENEERSGAWCGSAARGRCVDCSTKILGSTLDDRCADRVMTKGMLFVLEKVQRMVQDEFAGVKLKVLEAWDEPHEGATSGDHTAGSLHYEGRAATLTLSDGDASKLPRLAAFCICVEAGFVEHKGDHIFIAERKQEGFSPTFIDFPEATLIEVTPPAELEGNYTLEPEQYSNNDTMPMPLFDSDHREHVEVGGNVTIGDFKDPAARYFRLSPELVECYEALELRENKWNKLGEMHRHIAVLEGYLTPENQDDYFNMSDPRYDRHTLGWAMRVGYYGDQVDDPEKFSPVRLARFAVIKCGPLFSGVKKGIGVGLYKNSTFVDIREDAEFWVAEPDVLPVNVTVRDWEDEMAMLLEYAIEGRIIEPDSLERACLFSDPPARQSAEFQHKHSEAVKRRRRRRQTEGAEDQCIPRSDTEFCNETTPHRETEIAHIWGEVKRKHLFRPEADVKAALDGCFGACGTCLEGPIWEEKTEQCNNFLHWVNFQFLNEEPDVTNFWARDNQDLKPQACRDHCIVKAPLFSLVAPSIEELYRPDPTKSVKEQIYSMANNPSPVMEILHIIYAAHASGRVEFYVEDAAEMQSLRAPLKVVLVFNKNITEVIINAEDVEAVEGVVQNLVFEWTKASCPDDTRDYITPFSVVEMPAGISKRSPEFEIREQLLERHRNWEQDWIGSSFG
ncbi:SHH [Branchiostoma lanceolatum]|uniref:SHH protein n=1 Tax=Branchiostoma lanceolatum TaxID=7740 RepID=A0A8K0ES86_BRALA|nr:SHH [Branchiostoma lanceolatum]